MAQTKQFSPQTGSPCPLGVSWQAEKLNIAVFASDATQLFIHFFLPDTEEEVAVVELAHRTGKVFHAEFLGVNSDWLYAVQAIQKDENKGKQVNDKLLIDPYSKGINRPVIWNKSLYEENSPFFIPKSTLKSPDFDWQGVTKPKKPREETILYETHVKGFTQLNELVPEENRGTYLGLCDPNVIKHIKSLGVTSVQLMPVFSYMSEPRLEDLELTNYWGYNPINFFAPDPRYAKHNAVVEFKTLVRTFHENGLEVILDVVYNHTAEAGKDGAVLSFRGLAEFDFYLMTYDDYCLDYANYTGCGNTVNCDSDFSLRMIMDSLRYWLTEMQVDGFRFDLAATMGRNGERFNRKSALFKAIAQDPIVGQCKLIAEPWDIGPEGYQLGNFPAYWNECNDKYRDGIRKFWNGEKGLVPEVASRILGSRDVFRKGKRSQLSSVNYICYHDGFTLQDLVSYDHRHNLANLENNRDGHGANFSKNYGVEGPTSEFAIVDKRELHKRNLVATLLFSQGIPHLLAGDELSRTQNGNNNAYCQDNEISWVNWSIDSRQSAFLQFMKRCIEIRKRFSVLKHCFLPDDNFEHSTYHHKVSWIRPDGEEKRIEDWHNHYNQCLGLLVADEDKCYQLLLIFNSSNKDVGYNVPDGLTKTLVIDTSKPYADEHVSVGTTLYKQNANSMSLWKIDYDNCVIGQKSQTA
ncbi:glycogen debranching protein GlgX [Psychrosphaera sp. 1_MG-2023]|uniref:glycogen debranching protein GlgX n=1 Tax=Psychrosphaera sp. 1_MG-2023 TaxID=3062643 RepID=UPI0026E1AEDE|nr:glycogen debranching protein GlgX [Psychrosphaera sp. 1_MG-2023]MDO6717887.1 glycogen debranching protein GlgX [Psychrosphaera sp. 1_MG-2023]